MAIQVLTMIFALEVSSPDLHIWDLEFQPKQNHKARKPRQRALFAPESIKKQFWPTLFCSHILFLNEKRILWENICAKNLFVHFFVLPFNYGVKDLRKNMVQEYVVLVTGDVSQLPNQIKSSWRWGPPIGGCESLWRVLRTGMTN